MNSLDSDNFRATTESLRQARESLSQLAMEVQGLRERLLEISRLVQGTDNPDSLHLQFHLFKSQFNQMNIELKNIRGEIQSHVQTHDENNSLKNERGWQFKHSLITAIIGGFVASGMPVVFQYWSAVLREAPDEIIENPWKQS